MKIVTSRDGVAAQIATNWLAQHGITVPLHGNGKGSKAAPCSDRDFFIDDDLDKLEELVGTVPHLYLFGWGYNKDAKLPESIGRIESWKGLCEKINELS